MSIEERKRRNRERMPQTAAWMDMLADFAPRVIHAIENGHEVGKPD